jgi:hypothetical protein
MKNFTVKGRVAIPVRAMPFYSPGFFCPATVMSMLVDVEGYPGGPGLQSFIVLDDGDQRRLHPLQLQYSRQLVQSARDQGKPLVEQLQEI